MINHSQLIFMRRRHRHRSYATGSTLSYTSVIRPLIGLLIVGSLLYYLATFILNAFGIRDVSARTSVFLQPEDRGVVSISLDGGPFKRTDSDLKLYEGDEVQTKPSSHASLTFSDGTFLRMEENGHIQLQKSGRGKDGAVLSLGMPSGSIWLRTPNKLQYSGAIVRTLTTSTMTLDIPADTEGVFGQNSMSVFSSDGPGITVTFLESDTSIVIGEGQQFSYPSGGATGDLYSYRSALDPTLVLSPFIEKSRNTHATTIVESEPVPTENPLEGDDVLVVHTPPNNSTVDAAVIVVSGVVNGDVEIVRVNGYEASLNKNTNAFDLQLTLPDEDEVIITIEAFDAEMNFLDEASRTVTRNRKPPASPTITSPASNGQTYETNKDTFEITGTAAADTVGIIINDYRLQLFSPGDATWSYLASTKLDNISQGTNVYTVTAINKAGIPSEPVSITIVLGDEEKGITNEGEPEETDDSSETEDEPVEPVVEQEDPATLPDNKPILPGSLQVSAPTNGEEYRTDEVEFLIEGTTSPQTHSVWVNDYKLRLYEPGKNFWNYIASVELGTLKRGSRTYNVVTRNKDNEILDELDYVVVFRP